MAKKTTSKAVKGKVAKTQANQRFKIQTNRPLQTAPLDYFRWAYEYKQSGKLKLEEIQSKKIEENQKEKKFEEKIDELNQETDSLLEEIDKWQM